MFCKNIAKKLQDIFIPVNAMRWQLHCDVLNKGIMKYNSEIDIDGFFALENYKKIKDLTATKDVQGMGYVRIGGDSDGGYILADKINRSDVVYSFGIAQEVSFDLDMANRGMKVYMYDHTIPRLPVEHCNFYFFKKGIGIRSSENPDLLSMEQIIDANGHNGRKDIILKMDVEGHEYDFIDCSESSTLNQFSQITIELHNIHLYHWTSKIVRSLEKLNRTHQSVHIHANNGAGVFNIGKELFPSLLEVTYLRREDYEFVPNTRFFPTIIDRPNSDKIDEILLGKW